MSLSLSLCVSLSLFKRLKNLGAFPCKRLMRDRWRPFRPALSPHSQLSLALSLALSLSQPPSSLLKGLRWVLHTFRKKNFAKLEASCGAALSWQPPPLPPRSEHVPTMPASHKKNADSNVYTTSSTLGRAAQSARVGRQAGSAHPPINSENKRLHAIAPALTSRWPYCHHPHNRPATTSATPG